LLLEKRGDAYLGLSFREVSSIVHECAAGLMALGVRKGDRIGLISEGRNDWLIAELAIVYTGAINVPLSVKIEELSELKFRLAHSGCRMVIVSGAQAHKVYAIKHDLPDLELVILLDPREMPDSEELLFSDVRAKGRILLAENRERFDERWRAVGESDPANICYTSGTTADPKGIILSHRNYTANVEQALSLLPLPEDSCLFLILPWDHSFGHTAGLYTMVKCGGSVASVQLGRTPMETLRNIPTNLRETRPTFLLSVPALAKNFRKNIEKGIHEKGTKVEALFARALRAAYAYNGNGWDRGKGMRAVWKPLVALYNVLLFSKIRASFGGRLEYFIGGGALLDIELQRFFYAVGIPMYQGYGLTEAAPIISANIPRRHKLGTSGNILPGVTVKIVGEHGEELERGRQGEIVVRGENVMVGYWMNEHATQEALRDGWLHTGDLGFVDEDDFLCVLGRAKSLLIGHDGEKFSPEGIEETLVAHSPYIEQAMLHNSQDPYTVALLVPSKEPLLRWLRVRGLSCHTPEGQEAVLKLLQSQINGYRPGGDQEGLFPERWLPSAVAVLGEGFTEQNRMLNSTLKMVRGKITEFYRNRIDYLYTPEGKDILNHQNRMIIKRLEEQL
jgi:long-chain acyl-CoA synthetase